MKGAGNTRGRGRVSRGVHSVALELLGAAGASPREGTGGVPTHGGQSPADHGRPQAGGSRPPASGSCRHPQVFLALAMRAMGTKGAAPGAWAPPNGGSWEDWEHLLGIGTRISHPEGSSLPHPPRHPTQCWQLEVKLELAERDLERCVLWKVWERGTFPGYALR